MISSFELPESFPTIARASGPVFTFCAPEHVFDDIKGRRVLFSTVPRSSGPVFMFCAPGHFFSGAEGIRSHFHVLHSRTHFRRFRGHWVPFSCFSRPYSFSAIPRTSSPIFMCLRARTCFRQYRWRWVPFSCFVLPYSFSAVSRASGPILMFCAHVLVFGGTDSVRSRFHVLRSQTHF
jgi:hypothetical protein